MVTERPESRRPGVQHLEHREGVLSFARIATTLLHARLLWVTILLYPTASERGECMLALCSSGYSQRLRWWAPWRSFGDCTYWPAAGFSSEPRAGVNTRKVSPARQRRARGRIEQALLDGDVAPTDLRPSLANRTITPSPLTLLMSIAVSLRHRSGAKRGSEPGS